MVATSSDESALRELLRHAQKGERSDVEFKVKLDLDTHLQKAEFAKDVALQANLPAGGNIVYGVDDSGNIVGLSSPLEKDRLAGVLANRLMFAPNGIEIIPIQLDDSSGQRVELIWIRVPASRNFIPTSFLGVDATFRMPVRIDTVTKYLTPVEAVAYYRGKEPRQLLSQGPIPSVIFDGNADEVDEVLETNLFPFISLPESVWVAATSAYTNEEVESVCGSSLLPYRLWRNQLFCLRASGECQVFQDVLRSSPRLEPIGRMLKNRDSRRVFIGLLNDELLSYACGMDLLLDDSSGKVYFGPEGGKPRKLSWRAFSRTGTRTVAAPRLRSDGTVRHWYHFAMRLRTEDLEETLSLMIDPSWVFSKDGTTLIRSYSVTPLASSKTSLEDNARILYNRRFAIQFLSGDRKSIDLPVGYGGARISTEPVACRLKLGIKGDAIAVPEVDLDADIGEPAPIPKELEDDLEE
jgi:hypothetical protein